MKWIPEKKGNSMKESTNKIIQWIRRIPYGKVCTYGTVALRAGNPRGARQVSRVLHSLTEKENLPWHRVVNRFGEISIQEASGRSLQRALLESEGIVFGPDGRIDLNKFGF